VLCERAFAHVLDRGGMRRTWLRGRENVAKRYLIQVAAYNLGLVMRTLLGAGTPRVAADLRLLWLVAGDLRGREGLFEPSGLASGAGTAHGGHSGVGIWGMSGKELGLPVPEVDWSGGEPVN
jgi:hypothetical protein